jgi:hypothetical protein
MKGIPAHILGTDAAASTIRLTPQRSNRSNKKGRASGPFVWQLRVAQTIRGTTSSATMLMILISGFTAGPAVSL